MKTYLFHRLCLVGAISFVLLAAWASATPAEIDGRTAVGRGGKAVGCACNWTDDDGYCPTSSDAGEGNTCRGYKKKCGGEGTGECKSNTYCKSILYCDPAEGIYCSGAS